MTHKRDGWGYVEMDCDCEECYYYRLSYDLDTTGTWLFDAPGFAVAGPEENLPAAEEGLLIEALHALAGEETWKGGRTLRLNKIKIGRRYPLYGEPGEAFLIEM